MKQDNGLSTNSKHEKMKNPNTERTIPMANSGQPDFSAIEQGYTHQRDIQPIIQSLSGKISECLNAIEAEIQREKSNLAIVNRHEGEIKSDEAREHYFQAEATLAGKYEEYLAKRENIYQLVMNMDQALQEIVVGLNIRGFSKQDTLSPHPGPSTRPESPATSVAQKTPPSKKQSDGISQKALEQHAAAMFGLGPATFKNMNKGGKS